MADSLQHPAAPGPLAARIVQMTDIDQLSAFWVNWQGRIEQISRGRFTGAFRVVCGTMIRALSIETNQRVSLRGRDAAGLVSFYPVIPANAASRWQGQTLTPGDIVVHGPHTETDHCTVRNTTNQGISLRPEILHDAARAILNSDAAAMPRTWSVLSLPPQAFAAIHRQLLLVLNAASADPSILGTAEGHEIEQECVRTLVRGLCPTIDARPRVSLPGRTRIVQRAEELMRSRCGEQFGAVDLCRELGVSDRTLRLAFHERYGLGPIAYYRTLRLNAVRSRLKAEPSLAIADAARACGFHHLGNFAADYRRLFGIRPSATPRHC